MIKEDVKLLKNIKINMMMITEEDTGIDSISIIYFNYYNK